MRWPNGGSASNATTGGSTNMANQNGPSRMSGAPADRLAEQSLRFQRQDRQNTDIECGRGPGVAKLRRHESLEGADAQCRQKRAGHAAPTAKGNGDVRLQHVTGALGWRDQELVTEQEAGHASQRPGQS